MATLCELAMGVLTTADGREKAAKSHAAAKMWFASIEAGQPLEIGEAKPPLRPARPAQPELLSPRDMPKRKPGSPKGRSALLHAIAHIELNAIDLHWDIIPRFAHVPLPRGFYDDWVKAADEESKHFNLLCDRLEAMGSHYGALPAHEGLWQAAIDTANDFMGRLAIVPMVLEARGLDVTPAMIDLFKSVGDEETVSTLEIIYAEEVGHVAYGSKWFHFMCGRENIDPKENFHALVDKYFTSKLRPPFNDEKRAEAGLPLDFYWPIAVT
ncbi:rhamnosyltransferase [Amylibacter marinus]|uniref:Rhamnosyltransferase n=1 Tax=Amylibacter marinus TaxID=1475483 RepID=A0ABQ5VST1_9RHOB|nr:ferritin-like domain-containing protein [Amylibacter marinus]GLQ34345.1 rhamnosyltransferase [Amylibacter marinus]